jgi:predicted N-acetyltransferase YhbS
MTGNLQQPSWKAQGIGSSRMPTVAKNAKSLALNAVEGMGHPSLCWTKRRYFRCLFTALVI